MGIIEVFKTNVETCEDAERLVSLINATFPSYSVNFDLEDCDRILRIESSTSIQESSLIALLHSSGFDAAILTDEIPLYLGNKVILSVS